MANALFQVEIPRRNTVCFKGNERLNPGVDYYSLIVQDETQKIVRRDFCSSCWHEFSAEIDLSASHGYWKSRIELKNELHSKEKTRVARALTLIKELLENPQQNEGEIFVLALFLARARCLTLKQERELDQSVYSFYQVVNQHEVLMIKKMDLSHIEVLPIQHALAKKLQ